VRVATNGEECLAVLKEVSAGLILLGILMPKAQYGFRVLQGWKLARDTPDTRHTLHNLSQAEVDMNQELAKALGVSDYLIKSHVT